MDKFLLAELHSEANIGNHVNTILSYIETSEDLKLVNSCITLLEKHNCKNPFIYDSLENLIISDKNENIRLKAINALFKLFPDRTLEPLLWVLNKDDNFNILISVIEKLSNFNLKIVREALVKKIKSILLSNDIKCKINSSGYKEELATYEARELSAILLNILLFSIIKLKFKNLKYQFKKGYVNCLDYSNIDKPIINWRSRIEIKNTKELDYFKYFRKIEVIRLFPINWVIKNELNLNYFINHTKALQFLPQKVVRCGIFAYLDSLENSIQNKHQFELNKLKSKISKLTINQLIIILINLSIILFINSKISDANIKVKDGKVLFLEIINKPLYNIPQFIEFLNELRYLILDSCKIYELPNWIKNLKFLKYLSLKNNNIRAIPPCIGKLKKLKRIILNNNSIELISPSLKFTNSLEVLNLSQNKLKNISTELELKSLKCLDLSSNYIKCVPANFIKFPKLNYLNLSNNKIEEMNWISKLSSLRYLILDHNKIRTIPICLGNLVRLRTLSMRDNRINSIPLSVFKIKKLRCVDLRWNKIAKTNESINSIDLLL